MVSDEAVGRRGAITPAGRDDPYSAAMPGGAPPTVAVDGTPLHGSAVDVAARCGWLLRTARLTAPRGAPSLHTMARELGTSVARLHRLETGQLRNGTLVTGYERLLGRPAGSLRAPIDVLCRTFPKASPPDQQPGEPVATVRELSALTAQVAGRDPHRVADTAGRARRAAAGDWLAWARALSRPAALGLPEWTARELVTTLLDEMNRSVGVAYPIRYEALALLRCGPYGDVVLDVARAAVTDPHVQVLNDMMSAVGEAVTPEAVAWCLDLLGDDRDRVVAGAVLALEAMGAVGGDDRFWAGIVDVLLDHVAEVAEGTDRWRWLSHLVRLVPTPVLTATGRRVGARLAPAPRVATWSQGRRNQLWADCEAGARRATDALDLAEQPMLARLVFDIVVSPYESHAVTSYMLLSGLPDLATQVCEELAEVAGSHADPAIAERTGRRLAGMLHPVMPTAARAWLADGDARLPESALRMAGCGGLVLPSDVLRAGVAEGGSSQRAALYAAGMTQHPVLEELLAHPDDAVAGAATWWRQRGPRLQEPDAP